MAKRKHIDSRAYCATGIHADVIGRRTKKSLGKIEDELVKIGADWDEIETSFVGEIEDIRFAVQQLLKALPERIAWASRETGSDDE